MKARGWVFVVSNSLAPELCRISFSVKLPASRVRKFNENGPEHPFVLEYEIIVDNPHRYKQIACRKLEEAGKHEWKDWFRCSSIEAAAAISEAIGDNPKFSESYKGLERREEILLPNKEQSFDVLLEESRKVEKEKEEKEKEPDPFLPDKREEVSQEVENKKETEQGAILSPDGTLPQDVHLDEVDEEEKARRREEERLAREKREEMRWEADKARQEAEKIRREKEALEPKELNISVSTLEVDKKRSILWEFLIILLTDIGCIYIIFAAQSVLIISVAIILVALFSLFLADMVKVHLSKPKEKKKSAS